LSTRHESKYRIDIHNYKSRMNQINNQIQRELSFENVSLIKRYDREMVSQSIAIATRQKHLRTLLTLSRLVNKNWVDVRKDDIDELVFRVMDQFADENGQETHYCIC